MRDFNSKIKKLEDKKSEIRMQSKLIQSKIEEVTLNDLNSLRLNNFYAECMSFKNEGLGQITFKRPLNKIDYLVDSANNFMISYNGDSVEVRKLKSTTVHNSRIAEFRLSEQGEYIPSVCAIVCQDCS